MMNIRNKTIIIILCFICFAFLLFPIFLGIGINKGRETDKERQRNLICKLYLTGYVSSVTNDFVVIKLDSCTSNAIFPTEYIPAYTFDYSHGDKKVILDRKRLKISDVKKYDICNKNMGSDSILIGKIKYPLFD